MTAWIALLTMMRVDSMVNNREVQQQTAQTLILKNLKGKIIINQNGCKVLTI
jgi:hypothetical protein